MNINLPANLNDQINYTSSFNNNLINQFDTRVKVSGFEGKTSLQGDCIQIINQVGVQTKKKEIYQKSEATFKLSMVKNEEEKLIHHIANEKDIMPNSNNLQKNNSAENFNINNNIKQALEELNKSAKEINNNSVFNKEEKTIPPKEVKSILKACIKYKFSEFLKFYQKYGDQMVDSEYLLNQINLIKDSGERKSAIKHLLKFQLTMIGHSMSVGGKIKYKETSFINSILNNNTSKFKLEGSWRHTQYLKLAQSLEQFALSNKNMGPFLEAIKEGVLITNIPCDKIDYEEILKRVKEGKPVTIPTGWLKHAVNITISNGRLAYSNKGQRSDYWQESGIKIYEIVDPNVITVDFLKKIISMRDKKFEEASVYFENPACMVSDLGLKELVFIRKSDQKVGNCAWASAKCSFHAMLAMDLELEKDLELEPLLEKYFDFKFINKVKDLENLEFNQNISLEYKKYIDKQLQSFEPNFIRSRPYQKLEMLSKNLDIYINFKRENGESDEDMFKRLPTDFNYAVKDCYLGLTNQINAKKLLPATSIFKNWDVEHRKKEYEFFINFLKINNNSNQLISNNEELKLLGEVFYKFSKSDKLARYEKTSDNALGFGKQIYDLAKESFNDKNYSISDAVISLNKIKDIITMTGDQRSTEFTKELLNGCSPGCFIITERDGVVNLNFNDKNSSIKSINLNKVKINNKAPNTLKELMEYVKNETGAEGAFPVNNQKQIDRLIINKTSLD
ncbi:MAG: hypothetical protein H0V82_02595 [Candidatus Protochlamydia sp.]|nr:hypothetical protein [Candidatus Protochlamydia sp.]